jgi:hypothetical protein
MRSRSWVQSGLGPATEEQEAAEEAQPKRLREDAEAEEVDCHSAPIDALTALHLASAHTKLNTIFIVSAGFVFARSLAMSNRHNLIETALLHSIGNSTWKSAKL